jgi:hypothetical protein
MLLKSFCIFVQHVQNDISLELLNSCSCLFFNVYLSISSIEYLVLSMHCKRSNGSKTRDSANLL